MGAVELQGLKEAQAKLAGLRRGARNKILRPAMTQAVKPVVAAVKARVPHDSGALEKGVAPKILSNARGVTGLVGARSDVRYTVTRADGSVTEEVPGRILHFVDLGRKAVQVGSGPRLLSAGGTVSYGLHVAAAPAQGTLEAAWSQSKQAAADTFAQRVQVGIYDAIKKGAL